MCEVLASGCEGVVFIETDKTELCANNHEVTLCLRSKAYLARIRKQRCNRTMDMLVVLKNMDLAMNLSHDVYFFANTLFSIESAKPQSDCMSSVIVKLLPFSLNYCEIWCLGGPDDPI